MQFATIRAGTIFKQKGPSSKKKKLQLATRFQIPFEENMKILINCVDSKIYAKTSKPQ